MKRGKLCLGLDDSETDHLGDSVGFANAEHANVSGSHKRRLYEQADSDCDSTIRLVKATDRPPKLRDQCVQTDPIEDDNAGSCPVEEAMCSKQPVLTAMDSTQTSCSGQEPACPTSRQQLLKSHNAQQMKRKTLALPENALVIELEDSSSSEGGHGMASPCQNVCDAPPIQSAGVGANSGLPEVITLEDDEPCPEQVPLPRIRCRPKRMANRHGPVATDWGTVAVPSPDFVDCPQSSSQEEGGSRATSFGSMPGPSLRNQEAKERTNFATESCKFLGGPYEEKIALDRWPHRYSEKGVQSATPEQRAHAECAIRCMQHFAKAEVGGVTYELNDVVHFYMNNKRCTEAVSENHQQPLCIGTILEFMKMENGCRVFSAQRFFRAHDTATEGIGKDLLDQRRVFFSEEIIDCPLSYIVEKVSISQIPSGTKSTDYKLKSTYYFDMGYRKSYSTFFSLPGLLSGGKILTSDEPNLQELKLKFGVNNKVDTPELNLLDLYSGCGALSTGLCSGAKFAGANLVTKWAVDYSEPACKSLRHNNPKTEVYAMDAERFLSFVVKWQALFQEYPLSVEEPHTLDEVTDHCEEKLDNEYEVDHVHAVRMEEDELQFRVRWKGYTENYDTWEPLSNLCNCKDFITSFIWEERKKKTLPLPGQVDVVCGGPPCQGVSGLNRFRNNASPLKDDKNRQLKVFMDIVEFLKPRYVLMENVVDLLKFCGGELGRYSLSRLVGMRYQASIGLLVAGSYGVPQYRMRVILWGACSSEKLPAYPLPTHAVLVNRGQAPKQWENNIVSHNGDQKQKLEKALVLEDAISDLPPVRNSETKDVMNYDSSPRTPLQQFLRQQGAVSAKLFDHIPLKMAQDDLDRVCLIPKRKGANFRDLEGVVVMDDNTASLKDGERTMLSSGKPLVPDYALSFNNSKSLKPFGRLWWDETVPTVFTRAQPHNLAVLHPEQDRVLTVRENARVQGFPDHYKLLGDVRERYKQVGNAVAFPVSRALGYTLGLAMLGLPTRSTMDLPPALYTYQA